MSLEMRKIPVLMKEIRYLSTEYSPMIDDTIFSYVLYFAIA